MNKPVLIACALATGVLGVAVWQLVKLHRAEASITTLSLERDQLRTELESIRQRLEVANQRLVQAELQAASLKEDFAKVFSKQGTTPPTPGSGQSRMNFSPGGSLVRGGSLIFRTTSAVKALNSTYHALYRQLKFSPEQIEQFKLTMREAADRFEELEREGRQKGASAGNPTMRPSYVEADNSLRAELTRHFGAEALPIIQHFGDTMFLRDAIAHVANELFYTDTPLGEPQANQLVEIMRKNMRDPAGRPDTNFADTSAMIADAKEILSAPQFAVWREFIDYLAKSSFALLGRPRR